MAARLILKPKNVTDLPILGVIFDMDGTLCKPQACSIFQPRLTANQSRHGCSVSTRVLLDFT